MAVNSARSFRTGWITAATCSCLLAGGLARHTGAVRAQSPAGQVEMWRGNTRIGAEPSPPSPPPPPPAASPALETAGAPLPAIRNDTPWTPPPPISSLPPVPEIRPVAAVKESPPAANPAQLKEISQQLIRSTGQLASDCQSALDLCATSLRASGDRLVETLAVPVKAGRERTTTTVVELPAQAAERPDTEHGDALSWYKVVWLQVAVGGSALVVGPLMVALMLGLMLRRSGLQFRVEVINSQGALGQGVAYGVSRIDTTMPDVPARPVGRIEPDLGSLAALAAQEAVSFPATDDESSMTGEQFELGPSYEEERLAKEESLRLREQAILQEIFEENLRLREDLRREEAIAAEEVAVPLLPAIDTTDIVSEPIGYLTEEQGEAV